MNLKKGRSMAWGPEAKRGAIGVTFDNFGEAAELEFGLWPDDKPVGSHYTSKVVLPVILKDLKAAELTATFFIEGWNGDIYADDLQAIRDEGHDVGFHGWRHEVWSDQTADRRNEILETSLNALSIADARPVGFRPPGGGITDDTPAQLAGSGITYVSPVGEGARMAGSVVSLPFRWTEVDAFYFEPFMGPDREKVFGSPEPRPIEEWRGALAEVKSRASETGGCYTVIFHPYLLGQEPERFEAFREFIQQLSATEDLWVTSCAEIASWALQHPETLAVTY
jgi:peptidoglycan/xylan/chitin deacetylase (PgdA/CDA1 family)